MALDDAAAARRFPGPDYREVLRWIHHELKPATYVEIGVGWGDSLRLAQPSTMAVGIDPSPQCTGPWRIFPLTSQEFFVRYDLREALGGRPVSLALVDGLHSFEQALEDILRLERYCTSGSVIALHDTIPLNEETSARMRTTEFYTGDVWKTVAFLRRFRPELDMITLQAAPTGLTLISGFDPARADNPADLAAHIRDFAGLGWDYFSEHHVNFLELAPNRREVVSSFCQKTPVQSIGWMGVKIP
jgi:hypothetical protein